jgi:hypothetical protein
VNGMHVCTNGNLMRQEASEQGIAIAVITIITCNLSAHVLQWHISTNYSVSLVIQGKNAVRFRHWLSRATPGTAASNIKWFKIPSSLTTGTTDIFHLALCHQNTKFGRISNWNYLSFFIWHRTLMFGMDCCTPGIKKKIPWPHGVQASKFRNITPNICGFSISNLLHYFVLSPRILRRILKFLK